jgi:hypothetical protein
MGFGDGYRPPFASMTDSTAIVLRGMGVQE